MNQQHLNRDDVIYAADVKDVLNKISESVSERQKKKQTLTLLCDETIDLIWTLIERYSLIRKYPKETCPYCSAPYTTDDTCAYCGGKLWN